MSDIQAVEDCSQSLDDVVSRVKQRENDWALLKSLELIASEIAGLNVCDFTGSVDERIMLDRIIHLVEVKLTRLARGNGGEEGELVRPATVDDVLTMNSQDIRQWIILSLRMKSRPTCRLSLIGDEVIKAMEIRTHSTVREHVIDKIKHEAGLMIDDGLLKQYSSTSGRRVELLV